MRAGRRRGQGRPAKRDYVGGGRGMGGSDAHAGDLDSSGLKIIYENIAEESLKKAFGRQPCH